MPGIRLRPAGAGWSYPVLLVVLAGLAGGGSLLALAGCGEEELPPYDQEAGWKTLWQVHAEAEAAQAAAEPPEESTQPETASEPPTLEEFAEEAARLAEVKVDPPAEIPDPSYNPEFPPDLPFDPAEWTTTKGSPSVAMPDAKRGGTLRLAIPSFPPTIRTEGPNSRLSTLTDIHILIYEGLINYDYILGDYVPWLATHWQVDDDRMTFRFRIDPKARWADGNPVTADDVKATFEHYTNPDRRDPLVQQYYNELVEHVKVLDRLTVEIKSREPRWRSLLVIGTAQIYPARYIRMDGDTYIKDWDWKLPPGTGPYEVRPEGIRKGRSITVHRRWDYWDQDNPANQGAYNFDGIRWEVIRDKELEYEKFLAGELDFYVVGRAQRWVDEVRREKAVRMGWVQMRRIYNRNPEGYGGYCLNMRVAPFDSLNVRKAFAHLFNREKLFAKLLYYQYEYIDSYFPGQKWARPDAERVHYDPEEARRLLAEDGWTHRDAEGYLVNDKGERFPTLTLEYPFASWERIHGVIKDDLWQQAGIEMELKLLDSSALLKKVWEYKYQLVFWSWTASLFPEPSQQFDSKYADKAQSNNLNGFKNAEADRIMEEYMYEFDEEKRLQMLHRLDQILFDDHLYALGWYAPYFRILYWDRFGHPPEYCSIASRDLNNITALWWYDPAKEDRLEEAKSRGKSLYPDQDLSQSDEIEQKWWIQHDERMPR